MADQKVSQLPSETTPAPEDLFLIITDPNGTPVSKKITLKTFLGALPSNTVFNALVQLRANTRVLCSNTIVTSNVNMQTSGIFKANNVVVSLRSNPGSNNATLAGYQTNQIFFSNTHLYVAVNATTLKRVSLSTF